jgi:DNA helicase-2/ATP-dependent DNA helicase PcrA
MSLSEISPVSEKEEGAVQILINSYIDKNESLVFKAGAGAGKTYALTESLKYIIKEHGGRLAHHNQKIMCITYTNVATNEIKERLGNSDLVKVSTIHERLWSLIKDYQKELVKIHVEKIQEELVRLQFDLNENDNVKEAKQFKAYRELPDDSKTNFKSVMIAQKNEFYKYYDKSAKEFKSALEVYIRAYSSLLSNVANFKKTVSTIYRIENYYKCLREIETGNHKYNVVKYENKFNDDILHKMIISHDTLLDYALKMIEIYGLLRRVILDSYPYILIDEYQDTNGSVVAMMKLIETHAKSIQRKLFVGYFGDPAQNIYEDGVGEDLINVHPGLKVVNKQFNRRSHSEVIDVINKIRNDDIKQKSIYDDCEGGTVKFCIGTDEIKHQFIEEYREKWNINSENKLHCLVLMNKFVAEFNGFPDIYRCFSGTAYYKINYDRLNNELLSNDLSKLGDIPNLFYRILQFIDSLNMPQTSLSNLIDRNIFSRMIFLNMKELVAILKSLSGVSLGEYVIDIFDKYSNSDNNYYKQVIQGLISLERYSFQDFTNYLLDELFLNHGSGKLNDFKFKLMELFEEDIFLRADQAEGKVFKLKLKQYLDNEYFSCADKQEVIEFKSRLDSFFVEQKFSSLSLEDKDLFEAKLEKLFEDEIFSVIDVDEIETGKVKLEELLNIELSQWLIWYEFINDDHKTDTVYHTYHGTKGAEYDNVIIIMENDFGLRNKNKFSSFFKNYEDTNSMSEEDKIKFNNTKNLLYVSCSRSIKNLRILYLDDVSEFKSGIESIFGKVYQYKERNTQQLL